MTEALRAAFSLFSVLPVRGPAALDRRLAGRAVLAMPLVGLVLGLAAAAVQAVVRVLAAPPHASLLGAALAVGVLAVLTGALHLDGLADTADGLGSRRPADQALAVMKRSDVGPMGVVALVLVLLVQVASLASLDAATAAYGVVLAAVTGRTAVVLATGDRVPSARPGGFGSLVTGSTTPLARGVLVAVVLVVAAVAGLGLRPALAGAGGAGVAGGLLVAGLLRVRVQRRIGGMTGDVFGALVEVGATGALVVLALAG